MQTTIGKCHSYFLKDEWITGSYFEWLFFDKKGTTIYLIRNAGENDKKYFDVDTASSFPTEGEQKIGDLYLESDDYN